MFFLVFFLYLFPAVFILLVGLSICRAGQRGSCTTIWAHSLVASIISGYLTAPSDAPRIWLALALGSPLICVVFAAYSWFAQPSQARESETLNRPVPLRRWKITTLALALVPISAIVITKFHMTKFDASVADCKQTLERALIAKNAVDNCCESRLTCSVPNGFGAPRVFTDRLVYTGTLVGQGVILEAHEHAGAIIWECHVYPKIFGTRTCQGYDVGWH